MILRGKKLEVRVVKDQPKTTEENPPEFIPTDAAREVGKIVAGILVLQFALRIAEHLIVTRLK